jgi:hypothetical protein
MIPIHVPPLHSHIQPVIQPVIRYINPNHALRSDCHRSICLIQDTATHAPRRPRPNLQTDGLPCPLYLIADKWISARSSSFQSLGRIRAQAISSRPLAANAHRYFSTAWGICERIRMESPNMHRREYLFIPRQSGLNLPTEHKVLLGMIRLLKLTSLNPSQMVNLFCIPK